MKSINERKFELIIYFLWFFAWISFVTLFAVIFTDSSLDVVERKIDNIAESFCECEKL